MKQFLFSALTIILSISANAQSNQVSNKNIYNSSVLTLRSQDNIVMNTPKYKFLFENEKGKVFESPIDKMRCLVPNFHSKMPVAGINKRDPDRMPNTSKPDLVPPPIKGK